MTTSTSRRGFLHALGALAAAPAIPAWGASSRQTVSVLTNHNDDTFSLFEEAFEKAQSRFRLKFVWLMPPDAMKLLRRKDASTPDVWWQAAPHNHLEDLSREDILQPLGLPSEGLPASIAGQPLLGANDYYRASQLTAFSFLVNRQALLDQRLPWPTDWRVLAQPAYHGRIALPDPTKVRFGSIVLDVVLQGHGWEAGWALLSAIAGNARLIPGGLTDELSDTKLPVSLGATYPVQSSPLPVAVHLDTVPNAELRLRQPLTRVFPAHGGIVNAGYIGLLKRSREVEGGRAFASFVLSAAGQKLQTRSDLPRLPVRPAVYAELGSAQFNPFAAEVAGQLNYVPSNSASRSALLETLFATLISEHETLSRQWRRLQIGERQSEPLQFARLAEARHALEAVPLPADLASSEALRQAFVPVARGGKKELSDAARQYQQAWLAAYRAKQAEAARLLDEVGV